MSERVNRGMRSYWDEAARTNAAWYVDTSVSFDDPDMEQFLATGREVARVALEDGPVQPSHTERAVEIGSGLGRICLALADTFDEVIGIDISPEMVRRANELVDREGVSFAVGEGASLVPVEDGTADFVVSFTVFQHIPDPSVVEAYLVEAGRVLRPGGVFAFQWNNTPGHRSWAVRRWVLSTLQRLGIRRERFGRNAAEFLGSRIPLDQIRRALTRGGLELRGTMDEGSLYAWAWATKR